jgi:hypothetical protein
MSGDHDLTPAEEAEVTRLLAEAGGPVSTPPAVVARLDEVLAGLVSERTSPTAPPDQAGQVSELDEVRARRRRWPQLLLAASAVVLGGYGVSAVLGQGSLGGSDSSTPAADGQAASTEDSGSDASGDQADRQSGGGADQRATGEPAGTGRLQSGRLEDDVRLVLRTQAPGLAGLREDTLVRDRCRPPALAPSERWYVVRLDGRPATLVTGSPADGRLTATVYSCAGQVLAETRVKAP